MFRYNSGRSLVLGLVTHGNTSGWSEEDVRAHRSGWSEDEDDVASLTAGHPPVLWAFQTGDAHLTPLAAAHVGAGQTDRLTGLYKSRVRRFEKSHDSPPSPTPPTACPQSWPMPSEGLCRGQTRPGWVRVGWGRWVRAGPSWSRGLLVG